MQLASYRTAEGAVKIIEWDEGRFLVDGYEMALDQILEWDSVGMLTWSTPETQAWARSLQASTVAAPAPAPAAAVAEPQPEPAPETTPDTLSVGSRLALLADMLAAFAQYPGYTAQYGTDTDVTIDNKVAQASWGTGKKKVEYSAHMKAVEPERTLYFFEILKEQGAGLSFGGFESESYTTFGKKRSGKTKEVVLGPNGVAMDYEWDYGQTRAIVESVCARHGWTVKVVLRPGSAKY